MQITNTHIKNTKTSVCSFYTEYKKNTGQFPDSQIVAQRALISYDDCKMWCDLQENCGAAVISPESFAERECFLVSSVDITYRTGWFAAIKNGPCGGITGLLFLYF